MITVGRTRIKPDSSVLFALALYLGVRAGERVTRAEVLDLLWPDTSEADRRHALRQLLYRLKRSGFSIDGDGDELTVDPTSVDSDAKGLLAEGWVDQVPLFGIPALAEVLPAYAPAISSAYDSWVDSMRARCGTQIRRAALRHVARARREGRWTDLEFAARRCLDTDSLNEEATLALAEAIAMSGSKAEAVRLLDAYLWELGEPDKSIVVPARLLRRRISDQPVYRAPRAGEPPLIARGDDIAWLNAHLEETNVGNVSTAMLVGPPGIGKSAVVRTFVSHAEMRGWRFLESRLQPSDVDRPMSIFVELIPPLLKAAGALGAAPESIAQLRRLIEQNVVDDILTNKSQEAEAVQARIRTSMADLLGAVTHEGPLVLVLEDLHWVDKQSLRLLTWLLDHASTVPVFWLMTTRKEGCFASVREVLPPERVPSRTVEPLAQKDAVDLFEAHLGQSHRERAATMPQLAYELTGGNPLFIREVAGHWRDTNGREALPSNLRELMRGRVSRLSAMAQRVMHCCAMLGRFASVSRVSLVLELGTTDLLACIEEVDTLGLLGLGGEPGSLALHDLWQEEILGAIRPASRALLHLRCGEVLEREAGGSNTAAMVSDAARHLIAGGAKARALTLLQDAAGHQLANGLSEDAVMTCRLAMNNAPSPDERTRIVPMLVEALQQIGNWEETFQICSEAVNLSSTHTTVELAALESLWRTGRDPTACLEGLLKCAEDASASADHRVRACLMAARCAANSFDTAGLSRAGFALANARDAGSHEFGSALAAELILECEAGDMGVAILRGDELIAFERSSGSIAGLARALRFAAYPRRATGEGQRAVQLTLEAFEIAVRCQLVEHACQASDCLASIHYEEGELTEAEEWLERAEQWAKKAPTSYAQRSLILVRSLLYLRTGRGDQVPRLLAHDRMCEAPTSIREQLAILEVRCRYLATIDDRAALTDVACQLHALLESTKHGLRQDSYVSALMGAWRMLGNDDEADQYSDRYRREWRRDTRQLPIELQTRPA